MSIAINPIPLKNKVNNRFLSLSGVTLGYGGTISSPGVIAVSNISFTVNAGEFVGIIGPNGSGKSTLLKGILGLLKVLAGQIGYPGFGEASLSLVRQQIGYVPQKSKNDISFPALVKEVVLMGLYSRIGWVRPIRSNHWEKVYDSLRVVGMDEFSDRPIGSLSGGQQQRVMIARALVTDPQLLMLDEPTASVDISAQQEILDTLAKLNQEQGMTIMMVTHDINEIVHSCDKILLINGSFNCFGTPGEALTKVNLKKVYGDRIYVHDHHGHPHILVGDFDE
jgi:ABC-type Mn2+/Zn2+ transport system ATPase subunit